MSRLRFGAAALVLGLMLGVGAGSAQQFGADDPLPPGAKAEVSPLKGEVLDLKSTVLEIRGIASGMTAHTESLQGALKDLGAKVTGQEIKISLAADVLFDFDKADLRPEAGAALQKVAAVVKSYPRASVLIEGHTDGKGGDDYNQRLSERRAGSVRQWLTANGVAAQMTIRGWGKTRPVAPNTLPNGADNPDGRQKNRRVEITVKTG